MANSKQKVTAQYSVPLLSNTSFWRVFSWFGFALASCALEGNKAVLSFSSGKLEIVAKQ